MMDNKVICPMCNLETVESNMHNGTFRFNNNHYERLEDADVERIERSGFEKVCIFCVFKMRPDMTTAEVLHKWANEDWGWH